MTRILSTPETTPQTINSADLPVTLLQMSTGEKTDVNRDPGLILTQEDIINIKLYVKAGLSLPIKDNEVISYLGYSSVGIAGLEPVDIKSLFLAIKSNVGKWDSLESEIKQQSINLDIFATKITSTGTDIIDVIGEMPVMKRVRNKVGTTNLNKIDPKLKIPFDNDDGTIAYELKGLLKIIEDDITEQRDITKAIKEKISNFRTEISEKLEPSLANKRKLIKDNKISNVSANLRRQINEKNDRIDQLKKDYDKYFTLAFTGLAVGVIGLAITGGIYGYKASQARKDRNKLISEKKKLVKQLSSNETLEKAVQSLGDSFFDIHTRLIDAEQAAQHLEFVWNTMLQNIEASLKAFDGINDGLSLVRFKTKFGEIVNPWKKVKDYSSKLIVLFDKALEVYRQQQGI